MAESFVRRKFKGHGKKGVSGFWKRGREITSLVASSVGAGDLAFLNCFGRVIVSNQKIECLISGVVEV